MNSTVIDRYDSGCALLAAATSGLEPEHERARPGPGLWSIAELTAHLVDSDLVHSDRMKRVIAEEAPVLVAFDEDAWIKGLRSGEMRVEEAVNLFVANRKWMTKVLRGCDDADFARSGMHTESGKKTLAELVVGTVGHLDHHLRFLYAKRANLGIAVAPGYSSN